MSYQDIVLQKEGPIAILTLNRPKQINALSLNLMREFLSALKEVGADDETRGLIVKASGKHFCAGHDIGEMRQNDIPAFRETFATVVQLMNAIRALPKPVIAQVHGVATAAGCQLVATCDLAVAEEGARFAVPGQKIAVFCSTPMVPLSRAVGPKKAMEMLLTADFIDAHEARAFGLINKVVSPSALEDETMALAQKVTAFSPFVTALGKQAFYTQLDMPQLQAYEYVREVMGMNAATEDVQEGMAAFLEKRTPEWKGK